MDQVPEYCFSALKGNKYKKKRVAIGVSLGYTRFNPRQAVLYYFLDSTTLDGEVRYLAYETGRITLTLRRDFILAQHAELFLGMDIGYQYVCYEYNEESIFETKIGLIPKAGLSYILSKRLGVNLSVKYDIMIGETNETGFPYNPDAGNFTTCLEFGTGFFFRFVD